MKSCPIQDLEFENILKEMRFLILKNIDNFEKSNIHIFFEALALQCFVNEYIYITSSDEDNYFNKLKRNVEKNYLKTRYLTLLNFSALEVINH